MNPHFELRTANRNPHPKLRTANRNSHFELRTANSNPKSELSAANSNPRVGSLLIYRARICKPFKEPRIRFPAWRNRFLGGLVRQPYMTYRTARLHRMAESIPGLHKRLQIQPAHRVHIEVEEKYEEWSVYASRLERTHNS